MNVLTSTYRGANLQSVCTVKYLTTQEIISWCEKSL